MGIPLLREPIGNIPVFWSVVDVQLVETIYDWFSHDPYCTGLSENEAYSFVAMCLLNLAFMGNICT